MIELRLVYQDNSFEWGSHGLRIPHTKYALQFRWIAPVGVQPGPWTTVDAVNFSELSLDERKEITDKSTPKGAPNG